MNWIGIAIGYVAIVLAFLFMWHRFIQFSRASEPPTCFESNPGPQERAENDCLNCPWRERCIGPK